MRSVLADIYYPHPFGVNVSNEAVSIKHRCHDFIPLEMPSDFFLYINNERLNEYLTDMLGSKPLDVTMIYGRDSTIEKMVIYLEAEPNYKFDRSENDCAGFDCKK